MSAESVIAVARGELGYIEKPSNMTKYWAEYDPSFQGQPWCVAFLWWCFQHGGESAAFMGGGKTASCGILLRWYQAMGQTVDIEDIQVGDIALYNFHGGKDPEHCGLVYEVNRWSGTRKLILVQSIEGNTSVNGLQDNGGMVCEKTRYPSQIVAVCRPKYKEEPVLKDDYSHIKWAAAEIRWCMDHGIMVGYPDGTFLPDKPVTRAETAVICKRIYSCVEDEMSELRQEIARLKEAIK